MKTTHLFFLFVLVFCVSAYSNTTLFWQKQLNLTKIYFQSYSGYQQIDWHYGKGRTGMFYNLFGAADHDVFSSTDIAPLIIWLQGGPGSGSQFGAFTQIGPVRIENGVPKVFQRSWNMIGHVLFIDSPLNAGFSYSGGDRHGKDQVSSTSQATNHLLNFLSNFYKEFPNLKKSPLYIAGESFAGHYIPNLARKILTNTTFRQETSVNLQGIIIGNGWTDPVNQVNFFDSYLWSVGIIERKFRDTCAWYQTTSIVNIFQKKFNAATEYINFFIDNKTTPEVYMGNISMFNFRNYNGIDRSFVQFLNSNKNTFGANVEYLGGNQAIYDAFGNDISTSYAGDVIVALRNVKVLIYNGQNDVVVNSAGVMHYLNSLYWEGITNWKRTPKTVWTISGQVQGWAKVSGNLWYVHVNGAGHMVPSDKPGAAYSMLGHFIHNEHDWRQ